MKEFRWMFSGKRDALIFLLVESSNGYFRCDAPFRCENAFAIPASAENMKPGIYRIWLPAGEKEAKEICCAWGDGVIPFVMPGPGITPSHFPKPEPSLRLAGGQDCTLYVPMEKGQKTAYVAFQKQGGAEPEICLHDEGGEIQPDWLPVYPGMPYRCARIPVSGKDLQISAKIASPMRLTVWEGNPLLLDAPEESFPMGGIRLLARDQAGRRMDARFEVYVGRELVLQRDVLAHEDCVAELPEGAYTVFVHHGGRFSRFSAHVSLRRGDVVSVEACLRELVSLPKGWAWGDEHIHSVFEDGSPLPDMILRAARATGSNYAFLTDHEVEDLIKFGVSWADEPGVFVGMAGQEIVCHELHMNILNTPWQIPVELMRPAQVHGDICEKIEGWLKEIGRMKERQPVSFMLNHPSHSEATRTNPSLGYFRSWWVRDRFPQFKIVENFDFQGWFDLLNRGERITGVWTTDSHDCSRLYAGKKGTCVYVGDALTPENILRGLENGHCFSARWPGAAIFLTVNGVGMGDKLCTKPGETRVAHVSVQSATPMEMVDVVANGFVVAEIPAHGATQMEADVPLPEDAIWAVARMRVQGGEWPQDDHCFEPLMTSGFAAFTNPVYLQREA